MTCVRNNSESSTFQAKRIYPFACPRSVRNKSFTSRHCIARRHLRLLVLVERFLCIDNINTASVISKNPGVGRVKVTRYARSECGKLLKFGCWTNSEGFNQVVTNWLEWCKHCFFRHYELSLQDWLTSPSLLPLQQWQMILLIKRPNLYPL